MPAYVARFRCKCGDCRTVCCHGWRIHLTEREYLRLTSLSCSEELRARIDAGVSPLEAPTADAYAYITHGEDGRCPMLNEAGLCSLQTECGAEVQPAVCRLYPRSVRAGDPAEIVCAGSCEATVELLMKEPSPLAFTTVTGEIPGEMPEYEVEHEEETSLRARCLSVLGTRGKSLPEQIDKIGRLLGVDVYAETAADFLTRARAMLLAFGREGNSISDLAAKAMEALSLSDGVTEASVCRFHEMAARFAARFPDGVRWYENLLANHLFFMRFPGRDLSHAESFSALRAAVTLLIVLTVCHTEKNPTEEAFVDAAAAVLRRIEHSNFYEIAPHIHTHP